MAFSQFGTLVAKYNSSLPTITDGDYVTLQTDVNGRLLAKIDVALPAGTNNIGDVDVLTVPAPLSTTGGGTEATALRVTIASDSTGVLSVDDNGGSLTVDGTVTANAGTGFPPVVTDGSAAGTTGIHVLGTDGTNAQILSTNATGHVNIADGGNSITIDNATLSVTGGGVESGALRVTIANDSTGVLSVDDNGGSLTVDGTVAVSSITTSVTPGTAAANLGKAEDAVHTTGDVGVFALAVRSDTAAATGANGDYVGLITDASGRLWVNSASTPDLESGTEADVSSDSGGAGDGTVPITGSITLVAEKPHTSGTAYITGFDFCCDEPASCELIVMDSDTTLIETIRVAIVSPNAPSVAYTFPRAIEVAGAANRDIKLRARTLNGQNAEAGGGINLYTR